MRLSVVIPHYYDERRANVFELLASLHTGSVKPDEAVVWDNGPTHLNLNTNRGWFPIVHVRSSRNVGCQARVLAGLMARGDYVLFVDNDVAVRRRTVENLLAWHARLGGVVTVEGRIRDDRDYKRWPKIYGNGLEAPQPVFLSLGRGELVSRDDLNRVVHHFPFGPTTRMDDLYLSHAFEREGVPRTVIPCRRGVSDLIDLPMGGVGMCREPNFYAERDRVARSITIPCDLDGLRAQAESA